MTKFTWSEKARLFTQSVISAATLLSSSRILIFMIPMMFSPDLLSRSRLPSLQSHGSFLCMIKFTFVLSFLLCFIFFFLFVYVKEKNMFVVIVVVIVPIYLSHHAMREIDRFNYNICLSLSSLYICERQINDVFF